MQSDILNTEVTTIDGDNTTLEGYKGNVLLIVNVASKCGLTPQYEQLENIQKAWEKDGFTVLGFPCNQFLGQEPGSEEEIKTFCSTTYGVTFPMFSKIDVNGEDRHPLYAKLIAAAPKAVESRIARFQFRSCLVGRLEIRTRATAIRLPSARSCGPTPRTTWQPTQDCFVAYTGW